MECTIDGHFNAKSGCPECVSREKLVREPFCRQILEEFFGKPFPRVRPNFLKNPKTGFNLELDCYNQELRIALEHNGIQHYPELLDEASYNFFKMSKEGEAAILYSDELKNQGCQEEGIFLITVPFQININNIKEYIIEKLIGWFKTKFKSEIEVLLYKIKSPNKYQPKIRLIK